MAERRSAEGVYRLALEAGAGRVGYHDCAFQRKRRSVVGKETRRVAAVELGGREGESLGVEAGALDRGARSLNSYYSPDAEACGGKCEWAYAAEEVESEVDVAASCDFRNPVANLFDKRAGNKGVDLIEAVAGDKQVAGGRMFD